MSAAAQQDVGGRIRAALLSAGRKPAWLAVNLDVHPYTVQRWISGTSAPSYIQMIRVADLLDQPLDYFAAAEGDAT